MGLNDAKEKYDYAVEMIRTAPVESEEFRAAGDYILTKEWKQNG